MGSHVRKILQFGIGAGQFPGLLGQPFSGAFALFDFLRQLSGALLNLLLQFCMGSGQNFLGLLVNGHVLDDQQDKVGLRFPLFDAPGDQPHGLAAYDGEVVLYLKIVKAGILGNDVLQQLPKPWDIPLAIAQVINKLSLRFLGCNLEGLVKSGDRSTSSIRIEY